MLEVTVVIKGRDLIIMVDLRVKDTVIIIFKANIYIIEAETRYKIKSSEDSLSKKRNRLN